MKINPLNLLLGTLAVGFLALCIDMKFQNKSIREQSSHDWNAWQSAAGDVLSSRGYDVTCPQPSALLLLKPKTTGNYTVVIEPNDVYLSVHLGKRLMDDNYDEFYSPEHIVERERNGHPVPQVAKDLFAISGVKMVGLSQYGISIERAESFSWDGMMDQVVTVLNADLPADHKG